MLGLIPNLTRNDGAMASVLCPQGFVEGNRQHRRGKKTASCKRPKTNCAGQNGELTFIAYPNAARARFGTAHPCGAEVPAMVIRAMKKIKGRKKFQKMAAFNFFAPRGFGGTFLYFFP